MAVERRLNAGDINGALEYTAGDKAAVDQLRADVNALGGPGSNQSIADYAAQVAEDAESVATDRQAVATARQAVADDLAEVTTQRQAVADDRQAVATDRQAVAGDKLAVATALEVVNLVKESVVGDREVVETARAAVATDREAVETAKSQMDTRFDEEIVPAINQALEDIGADKTEALETIGTAKTAAQDVISADRGEALGDIAAAKTDAIEAVAADKAAAALSAAQAAAHAASIAPGEPDGVAQLDGTSALKESQLPAWLPRNKQMPLIERLRKVTDGLNFGRTINRGFTEEGLRYVNLNPRSDVYKIQEPVDLPAGTELVGLGVHGVSRGVVLECQDDIPLMAATGHCVGLRGLALDHYGDSPIFDGGQYNGHQLLDLALKTEGTDEADVVVLNGALWKIRDWNITHNRNPEDPTKGFLVRWDRLGAPVNQIAIETIINGIQGGGTGRGIWIGSSDGSSRPEGLHIHGLAMFLTNRSLVVQKCLSVTVTNSTLDQGDDCTILLQPVSSGIEEFILSGGYVAATKMVAGSRVGTAILHDDSLGGPMGRIDIDGPGLQASKRGIHLKNAGQVNIRVRAVGVSNEAVLLEGTNKVSVDVMVADSGTGVKATDCTDIDVRGVYDTVNVGLEARRNKNITINGSYSNIAVLNAYVEDEASGGRHTFGVNDFDADAPLSVVMYDRGRFDFGISTGRKLTSRASQVTSTNPSSGSYALVPHGLISAPNREKCLSDVYVESGAVLGPWSANIVDADATNLIVQYYHAGIVVNPSTMRVVTEASL